LRDVPNGDVAVPPFELKANLRAYLRTSTAEQFHHDDVTLLAAEVA
jgi:hypothetical protein